MWNLVYVVKARHREVRTYYPESGAAIVPDISADVSRARRALDRGESLTQSPYPEGAVSEYIYGKILPTIPVEDLRDSPGLDPLIALARRLIDAWRGDAKRQIGWARRLGAFLSKLLIASPDPEADAIIDSLQLPVHAKLCCEILEDFARSAFAVETLDRRLVGRWRRLHGLVLNVPAKSRGWEYSDYGDLIHILAFSYQFTGQSIFTKSWTHLPEFFQDIERWIARFGGKPEQLSALIVLLDQHGQHVPATAQIRWIAASIADKPVDADIWKHRNNVERLGHYIASLWDAQSSKMSVADRKALASVIDRLVPLGSVGAADVQSALNAR
jgi:hypothetical protein